MVSLYMRTILINSSAEEVDITHKIRKSAQTGVPQRWRLRANDTDQRLCPIRALIRMATVYGPELEPTGSVFLQTTSYGAVDFNRPVVISLFISLSCSDTYCSLVDSTSHFPCVDQASATGWDQRMGSVWDSFLPTWWLPAPSQV